jgi:2-polyprenyl-3-methyl-5-hydroxy-6-metoxy-1,4-benzoquinol methylase
MTRNNLININTSDYWNKEQDGNIRKDYLGFWICRFISDDIKDRKRLGEDVKTVSVLDIGCSTGGHLYDINKLINNTFPGIKVELSGIDISNKMIDKCKILIPTGKFYAVDVNDFVKVSHITYDYIVCYHTLEHIENADDIIDYFVRHCRRRIFIEVPYKHYIYNKEHINNFDETSFDRYKEILGYKVEDVGHHPVEERLNWIVIAFDFRCYKLQISR